MQSLTFEQFEDNLSDQNVDNQEGYYIDLLVDEYRQIADEQCQVEEQRISKKELTVQEPAPQTKKSKAIQEAVNQKEDFFKFMMSHSIEPSETPPQIPQLEIRPSKQEVKENKVITKLTPEIQWTGRPLFEFNGLLKKLFTANYLNHVQPELTPISDSFNSSETYYNQWEQALIADSIAKVKKKLYSWGRKRKGTFKRVQIKLENTPNEGTIFAVRDSDRGGFFMKEQVVLVMQMSYFRVEHLNKFEFNRNVSFLGLIINNSKIQTFIDPKKVPNKWTDMLVYQFMNITPMIRQYTMLKRLKYSMLCGLIYDPAQVNVTESNIRQLQSDKEQLLLRSQGQQSTQEEEADNIESTLKDTQQLSNSKLMWKVLCELEEYLDNQQLTAVSEVSQSCGGLHLVTGYPGTGKTEVLLGILECAYEYMSQLQQFPKRKILLCAGTNEELDQLLVRILNSQRLKSRGMKLIRLGTTYNDEVFGITLDEMVQQSVFKNQDKDKQSEEHKQLLYDVRRLNLEINQLKKRQQESNQAEYQQWQQKINRLHFDKNRVLDQVMASREKQFHQRQEQFEYETAILDQCEVIAVTLIQSGSSKLTLLQRNFDLVLIDDAGRVTEPETLIPLSLFVEVQKVVLFGDPVGLRPQTWIECTNYDRPLIQRILQNQYPRLYDLKTQYRQHPHISEYPAKVFYNQEIINMPLTNVENFRQRNLIIDLYDSKEIKSDNSFVNQEEVTAVFKLVCSLQQRYPHLSISILTYYKQQMQLMTLEIEKFNFTGVAVSTIDSAREITDIVIISTVRTQAILIPYIDDIHRITHALTQPKEALFIFTHATMLLLNINWRNILQDRIQKQHYRRTSAQNYLLADTILNDHWHPSDMQMMPLEKKTTLKEPIVKIERQNLPNNIIIDD